MQITQVAPGDLYPNPANPRRSRDDARFAELVASIESEGILEPIRVMENGDGYRIESGHRRWEAAMAAKLDLVPVIIITAETPPVDEAIRALVTNVQREDMNVIDEALAFQALVKDHGLTEKGVAERCGVSPKRVTERLDLLKLPEAVQELFLQGRLPISTRVSLKGAAKVSTHLSAAMGRFVAEAPEFGAILATDPWRIAATIVREGYELHGRALLTNNPLITVGSDKIVHSHIGDLDKELVKRIQALYTDGSRWGWAFDEQDLDQARGVGLLYEPKRPGDDVAIPILVDLPWAIGQLEVRVGFYEQSTGEAENPVETDDTVSGEAVVPEDGESVEEAVAKATAVAFKKKVRAVEQEAADAAERHNTELGVFIATHLADYPSDLPVELAQTLAMSLVGHNPSKLGLSGLRFVLPHGFTEEKTSKGVKRVYVAGSVQNADDVVAWVQGGKTSSGLLGRAISVLAASLYADGAVVPMSQRTPSPVRWLLPDTNGGGSTSKGFEIHKLFEKWLKGIVPAALRPSTLPSQKVLTKFAKSADEALLTEHAPHLLSLR